MNINMLKKGKRWGMGRTGRKGEKLLGNISTALQNCLSKVTAYCCIYLEVCFSTIILLYRLCFSPTHLLAIATFPPRPSAKAVMCAWHWFLLPQPRSAIFLQQQLPLPLPSYVTSSLALEYTHTHTHHSLNCLCCCACEINKRWWSKFMK